MILGLQRMYVDKNTMSECDLLPKILAHVKDFWNGNYAQIPNRYMIENEDTIGLLKR